MRDRAISVAVVSALLLWPVTEWSGVESIGGEGRVSSCYFEPLMDIISGFRLTFSLPLLFPFFAKITDKITDKEHFAPVQ